MRGAMLAARTATLLNAAAIAACDAAGEPPPPASDSGRNDVAKVEALPDGRQDALRHQPYLDRALTRPGR